MKKIFSIFLTLTLFAWMMPLGAFIKPTQEKTACDGQRPFHMCSMMMQMQQKAPSNAMGYTNQAGAQNSPKSQASGGGNEFSVHAHDLDVFQDEVIFIREQLLFHSFLIRNTVLRPPIAA